jgi:hypothetical protein
MKRLRVRPHRRVVLGDSSREQEDLAAIIAAW